MTSLLAALKSKNYDEALNLIDTNSTTYETLNILREFERGEYRDVTYPILPLLYIIRYVHDDTQVTLMKKMY